MPAAAPSLRIEPMGPVRGVLHAPPSKSATNRALILAALARGRSRIIAPLASDDTLLLAAALRDLGVPVREGTDAWEVEGSGGRPPRTPATVTLGNSGTGLRFLLAAAALGRGPVTLDGSPRLRERPVGELADALAAMGARLVFPRYPGHAPVVISGGPIAGGAVTVPADRSSQFVSALLLVGPCTAAGIELHLTGAAVSRPYVDLTLEMMDAFGGPAVGRLPDGYHVPGGDGYRGTALTIEGDPSSAAYLFTAAVVTGGDLVVTGLRTGSSHPDLRYLDLLRRMGCSVESTAEGIRVAGRPARGIRAVLTDCPDLAPALAVTALFARGPTQIEGAAHLRLKESDRIGDLAAGLRTLGAKVEETPDGLRVHPGRLRGATLDPRQDHRLAMAFAAAGLAVEGVAVRDPECVAKSYPGFFAALDSLRR